MQAGEKRQANLQVLARAVGEGPSFHPAYTREWVGSTRSSVVALQTGVPEVMSRMA